MLGRYAVLLMLFAVPAHAATYYVSKSGSNSHTCAQAQTQHFAKRIIGAEISCLRAGDMLRVGAGTYGETIIDTLPSGTS
jgi:hypothetical protein